MILSSGANLQLNTYKLNSTPANLAVVENNLKTYIAGNETNTGPYMHGERFTTFIWTGGRSMEYEGGVTSNTGALEHEVFHCWFARGVKPATQNDSWIDEGWTVYNTGPNRFSLDPFDMSDPPVTLSSANPFNRITPNASYTQGSRFFSGLAAAVGLANLRSYMSSFYMENRGQLVTTGQLEAYLIGKSGMLEIADYFNRFVYGVGDPVPGFAPDLYIRDGIQLLLCLLELCAQAAVLFLRRLQALGTVVAEPGDLNGIALPLLLGCGVEDQPFFDFLQVDCCENSLLG